MNKLSTNEKGFGGVEVVLVIVVVVLIGAVGWLVYKNHHKTTPASVATTAATKSTATTSATNPFANWKSYCSSVGGICIKYPSSWHFVDNPTNVATVSGQSGDAFEITSPSGAVAVDYTSDAGANGWSLTDSAVSFVSVKPSSSTSDLQVVESITTSKWDSSESSDYPSTPNVTHYLPDYFITTQANATKYVSPAQSSGQWTDGFAEVFTNSYASNSTVNPYTNTPSQQRLTIDNSNDKDSHNAETSYSEAQSWLSSSEVQTAGQILTSVSYNK